MDKEVGLVRGRGSFLGTTLCDALIWLRRGCGAGRRIAHMLAETCTRYRGVGDGERVGEQGGACRLPVRTIEVYLKLLK